MLTADKPARLTSIRKSQVTGLPPEEVEYPEADGQPMAETDTHLEQMVDALMHPLKERYRNDADVYISGNLFVYYEEGRQNATCSAVLKKRKPAARLRQNWPKPLKNSVFWKMN